MSENWRTIQTRSHPGLSPIRVCPLCRDYILPPDEIALGQTAVGLALFHDVCPDRKEVAP